MSVVSLKKQRALFAAVALLVGFVTLQIVGTQNSYGAGSTVRINAGGAAQTVNGTTWSGCTAANACNGYVTGGFAWAQQPAPAVSGFPSSTNAVMHQTEWTGGATSGVGDGQTAFTFSVPVTSSNSYDVTLQFTELNKFAVGQRKFDVAIDGATQLSNFDIYQAAGGAYKTVTRTFRVYDSDGRLNIAFIRRVENAKVDAIEIVPSGAPTSTTTTPTGPTTTSTTVPPVSTGTNIAWTRVANAPFRSAESNGALVGNKIYVFGGFRPGNNWTSSAATGAAYDIVTNTWSTLPSLPYGLTHSPCVVDGNKLIFAGGMTSVGNTYSYATNKVLVFDTTTNRFSYLPDLPSARGSMAAVRVGRTLHVFGGVDVKVKEQLSHWTLNLDNTSEGWKSSTSLPSVRSHFSAVIANDTEIFAMGGMTGWDITTSPKQDAYKFDTIKKTWTRIADLPTPRSHTTESTMLINGRIWMFGGEVYHPTHTAEVDVYDLATNKWQKAKSSLPDVRFAGIGANIGNTVWYLNGTVLSDASWRGTIY